MRKQLLTPILGLFLLTAVGIAAYYGSKSVQLENQLEANKEFIDQLDEQMASEKELLEIDAMLMHGDYKEALNAYEEQSEQGEINDGPSVEMRVALIKELLRLQYENRLAALQNERDQEIDSSLLAATNSVEDLMYSDSLSFALEKAKVQLKSLKRQLSDKSFGEYLTFTNSKGSQMHYVGQVKNGKANGYGVALLNTGSRYEGQWKDNMRHGEGTYYWSDGQYYAGQWEDDERDGRGVFYGKDGQIVADGTWEDDKLEDPVKSPKTRTGGN